MLLLTQGNSWPQIVPSGSENDAVIVAVDQTGAVTYIERHAYSDAAAIEMAKTISRGTAALAR